MNISAILQVIVALGLLNVWLVRYFKETVYRGGHAKNLKEEFAAYGLPQWFHYLIGTLKIGSAIALIGALWFAPLALPAAGLISFLMIGALAMHIKIKDPIKKSLPALLMLVMSGSIVYFNLPQA